MKIYVKGTSNVVDLTQKDYVGGGGEGDIYIKGATAYKIYTNPKNMIPVGKINELSAISDPIIIRPENVLQDAKGKSVGYTMRFIKGGWTLCQIFPRAFRERNKIDEKMILDLVRKFQDGVKNVHTAHILLVDLNEMNFLVSKKFSDIYFIDTDSYQTAHYPATALMPSVRDWKTPIGKFTENSDWYSFGIVTFQMFTGIHPYKGKHPRIHGLDERMQAGISVFNKDVSIPAAAYPLSVLPKEYKNWYKAVFEDGVRCPPPDTFGAVVVAVPVIKTISGSALLNIEEICDYKDQVLRICGDSKNLIVVTRSGVWLNTRKLMDVSQKVTGVAFSTNSNTPVMVTGGDNDSVELTNLITRDKIPFGMESSKVESYDGRAYFKLLNHIYEIVLTTAGKQVIATAKESAQVLEHATEMYPGAAFQKLLGATYVSLLPASGTTLQVQVKELDEYRIMDARYGHGVLMVVGAKAGKYDRIVFRFADDQTYDVRTIKDITPAGLNFISLDSGVCVYINEDEDIEMFSSRKGSASVKVVKDSAIKGDMLIGECRDCVMVGYKNKVYKVSMKGKP